jgi:DNA-binding IclR family transcriptional regulator
VLERAVRILEVFDADHVAVSVSDIAYRANLPLSTASRLVEELIGHGLLRRDGNRRVHIGLRLWELASRASPTRGLRDAAAVLEICTRWPPVRLVRQNEEVLFIERLSAPGSVINVTRVAGRLPLHVSSSGLVLLAHAPVDLQERVARGPLRPYTDRTITDGKQLRTVLAEIRRTGSAVCPGFIHPDATGVAVRT